jgi:hypothetical protein
MKFMADYIEGLTGTGEFVDAQAAVRYAEAARAAASALERDCLTREAARVWWLAAGSP